MIKLRFFQWNSLFMKLLTGFLIIIVLMLSFNILSFTFFKRNIQREIIDNNMLNLRNTVDNYEKQIRRDEGVIRQFSFLDHLPSVFKNGTEIDSYMAQQINKEINAKLTTELFYVDNLLVAFRDNPVVLDKHSTYSSTDMFTKFYVSAPYNASFWKEQFNEDYNLRAYPVSLFWENNYNKSTTEIGDLLPIVFKSNFNNRYLIAAFLNVNKMYKDYHNYGKSTLFILNESGETLFRSRDNEVYTNDPVYDDTAPNKFSYQANQGYFNQNNYYYFYEKGENTHFTYVSVIPNVRIASQVERLNMVLIGTLSISVVIGVFISILLSLKFNNPIQRIIQLVQKTGQNAKVRSREFDFINDNIMDIIRTNHEFDRDLKQKNDLLKNLVYLNQINSIYQGNGLQELIEPNKPFYLVIFHLAFTDRFRSLMVDDQVKASYYIKEFINLNVSETFPDSVTLQTEQEKIVSLIFEEEDSQVVLNLLNKLRETHDREKEYAYFTIVFRPTRHNTLEIAAAYEEADDLISRRILNQETQIIMEVPLEKNTFWLSSTKEQELFVYLQSGDSEKALEFVQLFLRYMEQNHANAHQFIDFGKEVVSKVFKALLSHNLDISLPLSSHSPYHRMEECTSREEYESFFQTFITEALVPIRVRKDEKDPIKDFALDYVNQHYGEDISLELLADKLKISRSYLSTYFREKTGKTFSDYLNELRIKQAKAILSQTDTPIHVIAIQVGYQNVNSFIRMFKRICGHTPGEFRRMTLMEAKKI